MEHLESYKGHFIKIVKNSAQCRLCGDVITSDHVHSFKSCRCGEISVDGGTEYIRRLANSFENLIEKIENRKLTLEEIKEVKAKTMKRMRESSYSDSYYKNLIAAAEYYANLWYSCKI
jgi:hypothetical protein